MVLANGRFVTASAKENADLFWAVRGGGGNFGIITSFLFKAHPIHTDYAGPMLWHLEEAADIIEQTEYCAFGAASLEALAQLLRDLGREDEAGVFERRLEDTRVASSAARIA